MNGCEGVSNTRIGWCPERDVRSASVIWATHALSEPSIAITNPRTLRGGDAGPGCGKGGEIFERRRILFIVGIDMTMASTDFACVDVAESGFVEVWRGANVSDESGWP